MGLAGLVYGNPLQCSCLENPRDGGAWWAAVSGVAQSRTRLKQLSSSSSSLPSFLSTVDRDCHGMPTAHQTLSWLLVDIEMTQTLISRSLWSGSGARL